MPLTEKGSEVLSNMKTEYGPEKGEKVFYASKNAGTISGVDSRIDAFCDAVTSLSARMDAYYEGSIGGAEGGVPVKVKSEK